MKLSEKILYCRKKAGLSQDALADQIGVSRQAISKWETGDAIPETGKLPLLARAFNVTIDWLLSEDEPESAAPGTPDHAPQAPNTENTTWVDSIPGVIGKLIRRYGWLYGVYMALGGLGFIIVGTLARVMTRRMFSPFDAFDADSSFHSFATNNPVSIMGTVILGIGVVLILAGVILAIYLKKRGNGDEK